MAYETTKKALLNAIVADHVFGQLDTKRVFHAYRLRGEALDLTPLSAILAELVRDGVLAKDNEQARTTGVWTVADRGAAETKLAELTRLGW
jgi:hypothetical protein